MAHGMGADLYERLKHLKRTGAGASPRSGHEVGRGAGGAGERPGRAPRAGAADPMQLEPPAGWERISAGVWRRVVHLPSDDAAYLYGLLAGEPHARALALAG